MINKTSNHVKDKFLFLIKRVRNVLLCALLFISPTLFAYSLESVNNQTLLDLSQNIIKQSNDVFEQVQFSVPDNQESEGYKLHKVYFVQSAVEGEITSTIQNASGSLLAENVPHSQTSNNSLTSSNLQSSPNNSTKVVRFGCYPLGGFYNFVDDDYVVGYGIEIITNLARNAGFKYEFVKFKNKEEAIKGFKEGKIDVLAPLYDFEKTELDNFTKNHQSFNKSAGNLVISLENTDPYREVQFSNDYVVLVTSNKSNLRFEDYPSYNKIKVGIVKNSIYQNELDKFFQKHEIAPRVMEFVDEKTLTEALLVGAVDAIAISISAKTDNMKLLSFIASKPYYYAFNKDVWDLSDKYLKSYTNMFLVDPLFIYNLRVKYFPSLIFLPFSNSEIDYIARSPVINVGFIGKIPPFSYTNARGRPCGIDITIFRKIAQITNLRFNFIELPLITNVQERKKYLQEHNIKIVAGVDNINKHQDASNFLFSIPYFVNYRYYYGFEGTIIDYDNTLRIGTLANSIYNSNFLSKYFPKFEFKYATTADELVEMLRDKQIDVIFENRYSLTTTLSKPQNSDIVILPGITYTTYLQAEIVENIDGTVDTNLNSIINKAISRLDRADLFMELNKQLDLTKYKLSFFDLFYKYLTFIYAAVIVVVIALILLIYMVKIRSRAHRSVSLWEKRLLAITDSIGGGAVVLSAQENLPIVYANSAFCKIISTEAKLLNNDKANCFSSYVHPEDYVKLHKLILEDVKEQKFEIRLLNACGVYVSVELTCTTGLSYDGKPEVYCVIVDKTEKDLLLEKLNIENNRNKLILEKSVELFFQIDLKNSEVVTSSSFAKRFGWSLPTKLNCKDDCFTKNFVEHWQILSEDKVKLLKAFYDIRKAKEQTSITIKLKNKNTNRYVWCEIKLFPILGNGLDVISVLGIIRNVDDIVLEREKLIEQTKLDPLTNLYNKKAFMELSKEALQNLPNQNHAIVFIDLDNFKSLNDTLGHMVGDKAIIDTAEKLKVIFSNYDIISRFGGDEFCVFVKNIPYGTLYDKVGWLVEKLKATYCETDGNKKVSITCSVGVCCTDLYGTNYEELLHNADVALYVSKMNGRNRFTFMRDIDKNALIEANRAIVEQKRS